MKREVEQMAYLYPKWNILELVQMLVYFLKLDYIIVMHLMLRVVILIQPKKVLSFEDAKQRAMQWKKAIESLQNQ